MGEMVLKKIEHKLSVCRIQVKVGKPQHPCTASEVF